MEITDNQLKTLMTALYKEAKSDKADLKQVIAKSVSLGMKYQEGKIKKAIDIIFEELNKNNKQ